MRTLVCSTAFAFAVVAFPVTAAATTFGIQEFGITGFVDSFTDGNPPPSAPNFATGNPAAYALLGSFAGSESAGRVVLNPTLNGAPTNNANGLPVTSQIATLLSAINSNTLGLRPALGFTVYGIFDLIVPQTLAPQDNFGIRVTNLGFGDGSLTPQLIFSHDASGALVVRLQESDFSPGGSITPIGSVPLTPTDLGNAAIRLTFTHVVGQNTVTGSFALGDGTTFGNEIVVGTADAFSSASLFTRAAFFATDLREGVAIPAPGSLVLAVLGLVALGAGRRRRH